MSIATRCLKKPVSGDKSDIALDSTHIKSTKGKLWTKFLKKFNHLHGHFKRHNLPKLIQEKVDYLNCPISTKMIEYIFFNVPQRKLQAHIASLGNSEILRKK